jgi:hypothetical protein
METKNTQPEQKEINVTKAVLTFIAIGAMLILSVMQAYAFATDKTLAGLEAAHNSAVITYQKNYESAIKGLSALDASVDTACSSYMALKAYKETKGYQIIDPTYNPCQTMTGFRNFPKQETTSTQQPEMKQQEDSSKEA